MPVHCKVPSPTLVSHCVLGILIFKDGEVYLRTHFFFMSPALSKTLSERSNWDNTEDAIDNEPLLLSIPWSGEGKGNWGGQGHWSLHLLLCPWPWEGCWGTHSSSEPSGTDTSLGGEILGVLNLKGCWACGFTWGCPGPLAFTLLSDTAWAMALLPSCIVIGLPVR